MDGTKYTVVMMMMMMMCKRHYAARVARLSACRSAAIHLALAAKSIMVNSLQVGRKSVAM
jgi:hypothetical protein